MYSHMCKHRSLGRKKAQLSAECNSTGWQLCPLPTVYALVLLNSCQDLRQIAFANASAAATPVIGAETLLACSWHAHHLNLSCTYNIRDMHYTHMLHAAPSLFSPVNALHKAAAYRRGHWDTAGAGAHGKLGEGPESGQPSI